MKRAKCELCGGPAVVRCAPDDAALCLACDATVHGANFLVARHARQLICSVCHRADPDRHFSGARIRFHARICSSCEAGDADLSSSSSCISTADRGEAPAIARPRRRGREEEKLLRRWCRGMGMADETALGIATDALRGFRLGRKKMGSVPFRICAAAAAWFALKRRRLDPPGLLGTLEACSGVASRRILAAESRLALALGGRHRESEDEEEGWGESSSPPS